MKSVCRVGSRASTAFPRRRLRSMAAVVPDAATAVGLLHRPHPARRHQLSVRWPGGCQVLRSTKASTRSKARLAPGFVVSVLILGNGAGPTIGQCGPFVAVVPHPQPDLLWLDFEAAHTGPLSRPRVRPQDSSPPPNRAEIAAISRSSGLPRGRLSPAIGCPRPLNDRRSNAGREAMRSFLVSPH